MTPLVSVVIPAHNSAKTIGGTIASVLGQSWRNVEIVVVDDGSTDPTAKVVSGIRSSQIKLIRQENRGASSARNVGLAVAQGQFIQWLDADDLIHPRKLEEQIHVALRVGDDATVYSAACGHFYVDPRYARFTRDRCWEDHTAVSWLRTKFEQGWGVLPLAWLMPRRLADQIGPWDEALTLDDDGEYSCRMVARCTWVRFVPQAVCFYRRGNLASLGNRRSDEALESLVRSVTMSVSNLMHLDKSAQSASACRAHLRNAALQLVGCRPDLLGMLENVSTDLTGMPLGELPASSTLRGVARMFGWKRAARLKRATWNLQVIASRELERIRWLGGGRREGVG